MGIPSNSRALPYVPRLILDWWQDRPEDLWMELDASMLLADVSGFTRMSERLSRQGRIGAEEVTEVIGSSFATLLTEAYAFGGSLLKFGGDSLLLLFSGDEHARRAAAAAHGMRSTLWEMRALDTTAGTVKLRMSIGVHTGTFHFFLPGASHRELIVAGPAASTLVEVQDAASAGQILLSPATSQSLPARNRGRTVGPGVLLSRQVEAERSEVIIATSDVDLTPFIPKALRDTVLEGGSEPEHRPVTVAFIHYSHFDELVTDSGPDVAAKALDGLVRSVQDAVDAWGVAFLATDIAPDGGKIILTAGAPTVTGADEDLMLLALREVVSAEHTVPIEIGVHQGYVFSGEIGTYYRRTYTVMGDTVNLAARLMAKASPGQILTTPDVLVGSRTLFDTTQLEPFYVKGRKRPVPALALGEPKGSRAAISEAGLPLVGRDEELRVLLEGWESTRAGSGRVVELRAEAGMGKSRLLEEFLSGVKGARLLASECRLYQSTTPYFPFRSLLRQAFGLEDLDEKKTVVGLERLVKEQAPELVPWLSLLAVPLDVFVPESRESAMLEDEFRRTRLDEALESLLTASLTEPTVITIEDTHWMDEASRDLLGRLAHSIGQRPWMMVFSRRPGEEGFTVPDDLEAATRLDLQPLGAEQAADLINTATSETPLMPHQVQALAERAQGNPLFLIELLDALRRGEDVEAMPHSVAGLIQARIDRLPSADRTLLRYVSVLGTGFQAEHASAVLPGTDAGDSRRALRRLTDFLGIQRDGWVQFRHALIRDAAYEGLPYRTRQQLHARVADSILQATGGSPEDQAELLSLHYFEAKRWEEAWTYSRLAGDHAKEIYANLEAATFYERAIRCTRSLAGVSSSELVKVTEALGEVQDLAGSYVESGRAFRAARRIATDPVEVGRLFLKEAWIDQARGRYQQALRWTAGGLKAVEGLEGSEAESQRARLSLWRAAIRFNQGRFKEAEEWCERAIRHAEQAGDRGALAHALYLLDLARMFLGISDGKENSWRALRIYEELGDLSGQAVVSNNLAGFAYREGRWSDAIELYTKSSEIRLKTGNPVEAARATTGIGEILCDRGDLREAESTLKDTLRIWRAANNPALIAFVLSQLGRVASRAGRFAEAASRYDEARALYGELGAKSDVVETDARISENLVYQGKAGEAMPRIEQGLRGVEALGGEPLQVAALRRLMGFASAQMGDLATAEAHFLESLAAARAGGADYEVALTLEALGRLRRTAGRPDSQKGLDEAWATFARLGVVSVPRVPLQPAPSV